MRGVSTSMDFLRLAYYVKIFMMVHTIKNYFWKKTIIEAKYKAKNVYKCEFELEGNKAIGFKVRLKLIGNFYIRKIQPWL